MIAKAAFEMYKTEHRVCEIGQLIKSKESQLINY
jgi:hypothetical protein